MANETHIRFNHKSLKLKFIEFIYAYQIKNVRFKIYVFELIHTSEIPRCEMLIQYINLQRKTFNSVVYELKKKHQKISMSRI